MRIATVLGMVTLNRCIPEFEQASLKLVCPLDLDGIEQVAAGKSPESDETLVAWDLIGVGNESTVAISEGPEASMPFRPEIKPIDTSIAALLDTIELDQP